MDAENIHSHWEGWAKEHGTSVRATTMNETAKQLEIAALARQLDKVVPPSLLRGLDILEMGCGNGLNIVELAKCLPEATFTGVDYVYDMILAARENAEAAGISSRTHFVHADIFDFTNRYESDFDVVITDRCLINLNEVELQKRAIAILASKVRPGGWLLMIENCRQRRDLQNKLRVRLGMKPRPPAPFNLFFDEDKVFTHIYEAKLHLVDWVHFGGLHDLVLYVLVPALNEGVVVYDHPLVKIATELSLKSPDINFGTFGQNTLFVCRKP